MILSSLIIGVIALVGAYSAGLTRTWVGTGAATGIVLYLCVVALPSCHFLFDSMAGLAIILAMWAIYTTFIHRILSDARRCSSVVAGRRALMWQWGRFTFGVAVGVSC